MSDPRIESDPALALLEAYDAALPHVYGYLVGRTGEAALAEELTSETFLAAVGALRRGSVAVPTTPWLIGVARHKLADHWRRLARERSGLAAVAAVEGVEPVEDPWDVRLEALHARAVLAELAPQHRAALVLRYVDGLGVPDVARHLGRGVQATEALLVRARRAFRRAYEKPENPENHENHEKPERPERPDRSGGTGEEASP